jgi:hypothetical protein
LEEAERLVEEEAQEVEEVEKEAQKEAEGAEQAEGQRHRRQRGRGRGGRGWVGNEVKKKKIPCVPAGFGAQVPGVEERVTRAEKKKLPAHWRDSEYKIRDPELSNTHQSTQIPSRRHR